MEGVLAGRLLIASPVLEDPNFFRTVVLLLQHDEDGALGVVLNRRSAEPIEDHLPAWAPAAAAPQVVFVGGPVEPAMAIGLTAGETGAEPSALPGVRMLDFAEPDPAGGPVRIFSGYAGWGATQLEAELEEGAWMVVEAEVGDVFTDQPDRLWSTVLKRQPGSLRLLATFPDDLSLN